MKNYYKVKVLTRLFILFIITCLLGCDDSCTENSYKINYHVVKDTPTHESPIKDIRILSSKLELNSLENGFDSIQIRVWGIYSNLSINSDMIEIVNCDSKWKAFHYSFNIGDIQERKEIGYTKSRVNPANWSYFLKKLFRNGIRTLPDHTLVKNYSCDVNDPSILIIEYSDKELYKVYSYFATMHASGGEREVEAIKNIIQIISSELEVSSIQKMLLSD